MKRINSSANLFGSSEVRLEMDRFTLSERVYPPNFRTPSHSHSKPLFTFVLGGRYKEVIGKSSRLCERATALFHPGGDIHAEHFDENGGRLFIIEVQENWAAKLHDRIPFPKTTTQTRSGVLTELGARAYSEFERADTCSQLIIEGILLEIIGEAARLQSRLTQLPGPKWLLDVDDILKQRFAEPLTLRQLAKEVEVHPVHLAQTYRRLRGSTVGESIRIVRLQNAKIALRFTRIPIAQVALQAGFSDQSHLSRLFKKAYGITPKAYRESI